MDQHPVPQDITGFQFKLVGDMTLKQFGYLAGGSIAGFLFYSSGWYDIVKLPLALFSFLIGVSLAFVPIGERPLDVWITNFFRSIYYPTQYVWKKSPAPQTKMINAEPMTPPLPAAPTTKNNTQKLEEYLQTLPPGPSVDDLMAQRELEVQKVQEKMAEVSADIKKQEPERILTIDKLQSLHNQQSQSPTAETAQLIANYQAQLDKQNGTNQELVRQLEELKLRLADFEKQTKTKDRLAGKLSNQKQALMSEVATLKRQVATAAKNTPPPPVKPPRAALSPSQGYPPNTISGLVKDLSGKTLDNVIVLFKNSEGVPVRALRTNKLGQFLASTPLENGSYSIELEKEGYNFPITNLILGGSPVPPLEISA